MECPNRQKMKDALRLISEVLEDEDDFPLSLEHAKEQLEEAIKDTE